MSREKNIKLLDDIRQRFQDYNNFILTDYTGLNVEEISHFRNKLAKEGVEYKVIKNKIAQILFRERGISGFDKYFKGPSAFILTNDDMMYSSKVLSEYLRLGKMQFKRGYIDGKVVDKAYIERLAKLPKKEIILSNLILALQSPLRKVAATLQSPIYRLYAVLQELIKEKQNKQA